MARLSQHNLAIIITGVLVMVCPSSQVVIDPAGIYEVTWETFDASQSVVFSLVVGTQGWIGFGISKKGTMDGADIVALEWVTLSEYEFRDYHGVGTDRPIIDSVQDWSLITVSRNESHTYLVFLRPFDTADAIDDVIIKDEETYLIWALSSDGSQTLENHGTNRRGAYKVNILNPDFTTTPPTETTTGTTPWRTSTEEPTRQTTTSEPRTTHEYGTTTVAVSETTAAYESTTFVPGTNIDCDFQEILVHPLPAPCTVEFLCHNLAESIIVNNCGFIDLDPRIQTDSLRFHSSSDHKESFLCDFKQILVHPFPAPCRVEFLCNNLDGLININNCGFVNLDP